MKQPTLVGKWEKTVREPRTEIYPGILEFRPNGLYTGTPAEPGGFTLWDVGRYQVLDPERIKLSTANDAEIVYKFTLSDTESCFEDAQGNLIRYRRLA